MSAIKIDNQELEHLVKTSQDLFATKHGFRPSITTMLQIAVENLLEHESMDRDAATYWLDILENAKPHLYEIATTTDDLIRESATFRRDLLKDFVGEEQTPVDETSFVWATVYHLTSKSPERPGERFYLTGDNRTMVNEFLMENWKDKTAPLRFILCKWIQSSYRIEIMDDTDETRLFLNIGQQYHPEEFNELDKKMGRRLPETVTAATCHYDESEKQIPAQVTWSPRTGDFEVRLVNPKTKKPGKLISTGHSCKGGLDWFDDAPKEKANPPTHKGTTTVDEVLNNLSSYKCAKCNGTGKTATGAECKSCLGDGKGTLLFTGKVVEMKETMIERASGSPFRGSSKKGKVTEQDRHIVSFTMDDGWNAVRCCVHDFETIYPNGHGDTELPKAVKTIREALSKGGRIVIRGKPSVINEGENKKRPCVFVDRVTRKR